jgi:hypothetical protein
MQLTKASSWEFADPPAFDEPPEPVDDGLPLHATSRPTPTVAMMAAAVRAAGGHTRRGRRMTRMQSIIMSATARQRLRTVTARPFVDRIPRQSSGAAEDRPSSDLKKT